MEIVLSGSSGLVGSALLSFLQGCGHNVKCLVRNSTKLNADNIFWDPEGGYIDIDALEGADTVIHLAADNIASTRWTTAKKLAILNSRVKSTKTLNEAIRKLKKPPKVFLSASAVGFYGNRGETICNEETVNGEGFLADVCSQWEEAAAQPKLDSTRTILLRFGVILSPKGGALSKMLPAFRYGLGGKLGSGKQYMSWITIQDVMAIILFAINNAVLEGAVNVTAPFPVTNEEFTKTLGKVLNRPAFFSIPSFMLKMILGKEMANELLLSSARVQPAKLEKAGYRFLYPTLEQAFKHLLKA